MTNDILIHQKGEDNLPKQRTIAASAGMLIGTDEDGRATSIDPATLPVSEETTEALDGKQTANHTLDALSPPQARLKNVWSVLYPYFYSSASVQIPVMAVGDSLSEGFIQDGLASLINLWGISGTCVGSAIGWIGGPTIAGGTTNVTNDFATWWSGRYESIPTSGTAVYDWNTTDPIYSDTFTVFYVKESGGGTFKIQSSLNGAAYVDEVGYTAVSCANATKIGAFVTFTKGSGNYRIRITGVSGICKVLGVRFKATDMTGIVPCSIARGGTDYADWIQASAAVINPIIAELAPALQIFCNTGVTSTGNLDAMRTRLDAAYSATDRIVIGVWPNSDASEVSQNPILKAWANANGASWLDPRMFFANYAAQNAAGYSADITHPNPKCYALAGHTLASEYFFPNTKSRTQHDSGGRMKIGPVSGIVPPVPWLGDSAANPALQFVGSLVLSGAAAAIYLIDTALGTLNSRWGISAANGAVGFSDIFGSGTWTKNNSGQTEFYPNSSNSRLGTSAAPWGDFFLFKTITPAGTTGNRTIDKPIGSVNFAAAAASLVVTNSKVTVNSVIHCTVGTNDTTMKSAVAVAANGSFTIYAKDAPTAETRVYFKVTN